MYQKKTDFFFFFLTTKIFSYITGLGTLLNTGTVSSWFKSISNAYCEPGTMQGVRWGYLTPG